MNDKKRKKKTRTIIKTTRTKIKTARTIGENKGWHEMSTKTKEGNIMKQNAMH